MAEWEVKISDCYTGQNTASPVTEALRSAVVNPPIMNTNEDDTVNVRRQQLAVVNGAVESLDPVAERKRLEAQHGQVWDAAQLASDFEVLGFLAPYVVVRRRAYERKGNLEFQHHPRFYFNLVLDQP